MVMIMDRKSSTKTSAPWFLNGLIPYAVFLISGKFGMPKSETANLLEFLKRNPDCLRKAIDKCVLRFGEEWRDIYCG